MGFFNKPSGKFNFRRYPEKIVTALILCHANGISDEFKKSY